MNRLQTRGTVLKRTDYGEADRIVTLLTPDHGKLHLMARGVRKPKSKLAGGIELFSVSDVTFIRGRGEVGTLISTRLVKHYGRIIRDIDRVRLGYELLKMVDKTTEDEPEAEYFKLVIEALEALNDAGIEAVLIRLWFGARLLRLDGHGPNLETAADGGKLAPDSTYNFDLEDMAFTLHAQGRFDGDDIKFLRLMFGGNRPAVLTKIRGADKLIARIQPLVHAMLEAHTRQ